MNDDSGSEPDFFASARVAILGLGLMGGSLAMALRGHCKELLGVDPNPATLSLAKRLSLCHRLAGEPAELLPEADFIILAAPVSGILTLLAQLPEYTTRPAIVMDLGSTKAKIVQAMAKLPGYFDPIGAHPMCGKERSSLVEAEACLYQNAPFALTPLPRTGNHARAAAEQLIRMVGAHPVWINEWTHDRWVAATSHTPYLIANALAAATPLDAAAMVGPGYRSTTRVASSPASVMLDILLTNRENVLESLAGFRSQIDNLESLLRDEKRQELQSSLDSNAAHQQRLLIPTS